MAPFLLLLLLCMINIIADAAVVPATSPGRPAASPSNIGREEYMTMAGAPITRKLGNHHHLHHHKVAVVLGGQALGPSSEAPQAQEKIRSIDVVGSSDRAAADEPENETLMKKHRSMDKSVAGGGVILGGLATTFLVAVFCYIRATGRKNEETSAA